MKPLSAAIGLGSNLGDPPHQLRRALQQLAMLPDSRLIAVSPFYRSTPQGPDDQPDYVNACALLETRLAPLALLDALQAIERRMGRRKYRHWGERIIDLDILLYGDQMIQSERLTVPHPWLHRRDFVLRPLADIAPDRTVPGLNASVADLLAQLPEEENYILEPLCPSPFPNCEK